MKQTVTDLHRSIWKLRIGVNPNCSRYTHRFRSWPRFFPVLHEKGLRVWCGIEIILRRDNHEGLPLGLERKRFRNGLQAQHQVGVIADELPNLVDKENDPAVRSF